MQLFQLKDICLLFYCADANTLRSAPDLARLGYPETLLLKFLGAPGDLYMRYARLLLVSM